MLRTVIVGGVIAAALAAATFAGSARAGSWATYAGPETMTSPLYYPNCSTACFSGWTNSANYYTKRVSTSLHLRREAPAPARFCIESRLRAAYDR